MCVESNNENIFVLSISQEQKHARPFYFTTCVYQHLALSAL
jgi:hypothetical protein